eukprot:m51a1_g3772 putative probable atp-dependent rna helicase ddx31 (561) ;mRNA; f:140777-142702
MSHTNASKIQAEAIPLLLPHDRDALVQAETGSGKTLSYAIPMAEHLGTASPRITRADGVKALVLGPTRELCVQIYGIFRTLLSAYIHVVPGVIVGGQKKQAEKARIRKGLNVVIATPGRLVDHLNTTASLDCSRAEWLVLDEADRLLDLGFEKDITTIIAAADRGQAQTHCQRCNVLVSATLTGEVRKLARISLRDPVHISPSGSADTITVESERATYEVPPTLRQHYVTVDMKMRLVTLAAFLKGAVVDSSSKVIVFFSSIASVEFHYCLFSHAKLTIKDAGEIVAEKQAGKRVAPRPLLLADVPIFKLHGNLSQIDRSSVYQKFCEVPKGVIFCTDVAARGIDLPNVDWIVQYDPPGEVSDYIHRIGRTARIGHSGDSLLFLLPSEMEYLTMLHEKGVLLETISATHLLLPLAPTQSVVTKKLENMAHIQQLHFEHLVLDIEELAELAKSGFRSFTKSYGTHSTETKRIFAVKKLHLGHLAKSFAQREAPSLLGSATGKAKGSKESKKILKERKQEVERKKRQPQTLTESRKRAFGMIASEFASGVSPAPKSKKAKNK